MTPYIEHCPQPILQFPCQALFGLAISCSISSPRDVLRQMARALNLQLHLFLRALNRVPSTVLQTSESLRVALLNGRRGLVAPVARVCGLVSRHISAQNAEGAVATPDRSAAFPARLI